MESTCQVLSFLYSKNLLRKEVITMSEQIQWLVAVPYADGDTLCTWTQLALADSGDDAIEFVEGIVKSEYGDNSLRGSSWARPANIGSSEKGGILSDLACCAFLVLIIVGLIFSVVIIWSFLTEGECVRSCQDIVQYLDGFAFGR